MKQPRILNLGAGVQSTTIALMGMKNWEYWSASEPLPYPQVGLIDVAVFADTQGEPKAVYSHLDWLENQCQPWFPILRRTKGNLMEAAITKGTGLIGEGFIRAGQTRFVSLPFFLQGPDGGQGTARRHCTTSYKIEVIERVIKLELGIKDCVRIFGLSYDETPRIIRVKATQPQAIFPLFEMEMTRGGCKTWLRRQNIPHEVPRSACTFCPYHDNAEWRNIRDTDPEAWQQAIELDRLLREPFFANNTWMEHPAYLHRDMIPLSEVDLRESDEKTGQKQFGFLGECEGMCGV